jgi:glycopeptide antibiotics resistance protein
MRSPRYIVADRVHLVPFQTIAAEIQHGGWSFLVNVPGNIVAFVPLGLLAPLWQPLFRGAKTIFLLGLLTSLGIEMLQWTFTVRVVDIDDVLLNVCGAVLGYWLYTWWSK